MAQSINNMSTTWTDAGTTYNAIKFNVTDTASNAASLLMDLQVGGASRLKVGKDGSFRPSGGSSSSVGFAFGNDIDGFYRLAEGQMAWATGGVPKLRFVAGIFGLASDASIRWVDNTNLASASSADVSLFRDAANTLAQRNGTNGQTFRLYNTFTDVTNNFERGKIAWESNVFRIGTEKGAVAGSARALEFQTDGVTRLTIDTSGNLGIGAAAPSAPLEFGKSVYGAPTTENFFRIKLQNVGGINNDVGIGQSASGNIEFNAATGGLFVVYQGTSGERLRVDSNGNFCLGTTGAGASAAKVLSLGSGTEPSTGPADTVQIYSVDRSAGNTIPAIYCEGSGVTNAGITDVTVTNKIALKVNGTVYYLLATTSAT